MKRALKNVAAVGLLAATVAAQGAAPAFNLNGASGVEYTGSAPMSQTGNGTVYWFLEQQNVAFRGQLVDSWMVFYNPSEERQVFDGTITFDMMIVDLFLTSNQLDNSSSLGKAGVTYDYSPRFIGLEQVDRDRTSFAGSTLSIGKWAAGTPGDYIRVLTVTAVPEPETYALMLAGLAALGFAVRRRGRA